MEAKARNGISQSQVHVKCSLSLSLSFSSSLTFFPFVHIQTMSATWRCSAAYYAWDGYYSDEYSDDDYTDQDDYTDYDDSGSEYDDERSEYDDGRDFGLQYYLEEGYDAIYLNHNTRSWNTGYTSSYLYMYLYHTPSYGHKRNLATEPRNNTANWRIYQAISLSTPKTSKNDCDRRQGYSNLDNTQRDFYGANRHTNDRAASMPPISYGRASSESTSPRNRRAATCEPRLLFTPSPGAKSLVAKGREFEDYFAMGVEKARGNITAKVEFQKRLNITPGWCNHEYYCTTLLQIAPPGWDWGGYLKIDFITFITFITIVKHVQLGV